MTETIVKEAQVVHQQLTREELVKYALQNKEGQVASNGAFAAVTGSRTGRSPKDRFIIKDELTQDSVDWGVVNQPISQEIFTKLWQKAEQHIAAKPEIFISDLQVGACPEHHLKVRVTTEFAWHNIFVKNLFIESDKVFDPESSWQMLSAPTLKVSPEVDGVNSDACLMVNFTERKILLCGLRYAGEMKKAMFSVMNFLMPAKDVLPMHCAANAGDDGSVALFFGLSGTGKTTLSADPERHLIGDDEHGWSATGVFNFEGGCYAKCIDLSEKNEPMIYHAIRHGAIMENVVLDNNGVPDYADSSYSENSRCAYPRSHIDNCVESNQAGHPNAVVFLTCDLYGVLPPVAKLTKEQAAYHFLSGYTALVGSTEVGQGSGIKTTFSQCFGAPFFPRSAQVYADLLMKRLDQTGAEAYLVNTGWSGGAYGKGGERFAIPVTRAVVKAVTSGALKNAECEILPGFNFQIPKSLDGVDSKLLDPRRLYGSESEYKENLQKLTQEFQENFQKFSVSENIKQAGPV